MWNLSLRFKNYSPYKNGIRADITLCGKNTLVSHLRFSEILIDLFLPQRSCDKVMFLHLSVILFTGGCRGGSLSRGVGSVSRGVSVSEIPHTVTCGRYASYWKAFLFCFEFICLNFSCIFLCNSSDICHIFKTGFERNLFKRSPLKRTESNQNIHCVHLVFPLR